MSDSVVTVCPNFEPEGTGGMRPQKFSCLIFYYPQNRVCYVKIFALS